MQKIQFDYFTGMEAEQYSFYRVPKVLFTEPYGSVHYCVDETLRRRLETKLIKTILGFKMVR